MHSKSLHGSGRAALLAAGLLVVFGCASSGNGEAAPSFADRSAVVAAETPNRLHEIRVSPQGEGASVEILAERPLAVHTSYRDPSGHLVIELPNTSAEMLDRETGFNGTLVSAVRVSESATGERPLTRLVVQTTGDSEVDSLQATGGGLHLSLLAAGVSTQIAQRVSPSVQQPVEMVSEPLPGAHDAIAEPLVRETTEPVVATVTPEAPSYGTPDEPYSGPRPGGVVASRLLEVRVEASAADRTVVAILGDGEFNYSSFRLESPARYVLDLEGVVNTAERNTVSVADAHLDQIRIGQFKAQPEPVSRVVFDLTGERLPRIEGHSDGLTVIFADAAVAELSNGTVSMVAARTASDVTGSTDVVAASEPSTTSASWDAAPTSIQTEDVYGGNVLRQVETTGKLAPVFEPLEGSIADVELFEAQEMSMPGSEMVDATEPMVPPSFDSLVVNERENEYVGEPISMSLKHADLVETLRSFAKISDLNFVIQPGVGGSVTVELKNVPWDQALEQILRINNLGMDIEGTIVRIAPMTQLKDEAAAEQALAAARTETVPLRTVMKAISYASAGDIAALLRNDTGAILSNRGTVQVDRRTNTLIIRELPDNVNTVLSVIENLDTPEPQVSIEARIIEATKTFARNLGIEWGYDAVANQEYGNTTGLQFPNNLETDGGVGLLTGGANGFINLSMGNILNTFNLDARLQVAENEGLVNVVSAPRITTINNSAASIQSGLQIPIQTVSNRTVSVQFVNATLELAVVPHVTAEGTILLTINVAKRSPQLGLAIVGATNAPIATKEAQTQVIVRDGATAVIGGIYEVSSNSQQDRVPGLANIPILGHLFKNRNRDDSNDELMIFITPRIVQM